MFHRTDAASRVGSLIRRAEEFRSAVKKAYGIDLQGQRILDVGPGQFLVQSRCFALQNEVIALDNEVIVERLTLGNCVEMFRRNGAGRITKSVARKVLGVDRAYNRALRAALGVASLPHVHLRQGDASEMPFDSESFDAVYCSAVLHHVETPAIVLAEIARVLKTGGVAYVSLHLYSSYNGSLDARVIFDNDTELYWAHLQDMNSLLAHGARLNRQRLSEWQALFAGTWSGAKVETIEADDPELRDRAHKLLKQGLVVGYSEQELLTTTVTAIWQKVDVRGAE
jgi:SAM-dependent methyltransferase